MDIHTQSSLLAAVVTLAIAVSVQIRGRRSKLHLYFAVFNYILALWNASGFLFEVSDNPLWERVHLFSALLIPWSALSFFQTFLAETSNLAARAGTVSIVISTLMIPVLSSPLYKNDWANFFLLVYVFFSLYLCIFFIYRRLLKTKSPIEAARLWYLVIGGAVAITFSLTDFLPKIDVFFPTVGNIFTVLFMFFLSQILIQYRLLDLNELFGKIVVMSILGSILAANYGVLIYWAGDQPGVLFFMSFVASFIVLILFDPLRMFVETQISRYNFRERFKFERQLADLKRTLANVFEMKQMLSLLFKKFENSRRITHASLYLLKNDAHAYYCTGHAGPNPQAQVDVVAARGPIERLRKSRILLREEVEDDLMEAQEDNATQDPDAQPNPHIRGLKEQLTFLNDIKAGVVVPIHSDELFIGFLTLWDERIAEAFSKGELLALEKVAQQIGIVIENSKLVEKLRERDRLAALGEMSAGLAHEIRNPLGAIKGAAQLLSEPGSDEDEIREFTDIIVEEVDRLNNVVTQFLDYARPDHTHPSAVEIPPCIERLTRLLTSSAEEAQVELKVDIAPHLLQARGDRERLMQVFLNLGLNAIQASHQGGEVRLRVGLIQRREGGFKGILMREIIEIRFSDDGVGMSPEVQRNIFIPFFTTKPDGTGLGLPICQRIVRGLGGTIEVSSVEGKGSTFSVLLAPWGEEAITNNISSKALKESAFSSPLSP